MVRETGDKFRDTVALTVRGDGVDIPPFIIVHTYKNASAASGRRCAGGETPIKGMNTERMIDYIDHIARYVQTTSLLVMDRLSSHTAAQVRRHMETKLSPTGERLIIPIYLPPKSAFLISPLDMGTISAFKAHYYTFDRSSIPLKLRAVTQAWAAVSNEAIRNICLNCGIVGEESIASLRQRFMKEVVGSVPPELEQFLDFYDAWKSGYINVEGATRGRGVTFETPQQLSEAHLDGAYWTNFGRQSLHTVRPLMFRTPDLRRRRRKVKNKIPSTNISDSVVPLKVPSTNVSDRQRPQTPILSLQRHGQICHQGQH